MNTLKTRIVVDGNDGTGKTTLVRSLRLLGFRDVHDRGEMTKATDDPTVGPVVGTVYILLEASWITCRQRLIDAGRDMTDPYHQDDALIKYYHIFRNITEKFSAHVILSRTPIETLGRALNLLEVPIAIGLPSGRLRFDHPAHDFLHDPFPRQLVIQTKATHLTGVTIRSKTYPQMVALGCLDVAVVGSDALEGNPWADQCEIIEYHPNKGLTMVLAATDAGVMAFPLLRVATPYPEWAAKVLGDMGQPCTIFRVTGGSEALVKAGMADACFDAVETGDTLKANGLIVIKEFGEIGVCVIRRK